jgi:hypothetical protein
MKKNKILSQVVLAALVPLLLSACFNVKIISNVKNPDRYFDRAYDEIERLHRNYPDRDGDVHKINVLLYENSDRKLIKVSAPFWVLDTCMDIGKEAADDDFDFRENYEFDWEGLKDLSKIGPGLLVEIDDEDTKILVWID